MDNWLLYIMDNVGSDITITTDETNDNAISALYLIDCLNVSCDEGLDYGFSDKLC